MARLYGNSGNNTLRGGTDGDVIQGFAGRDKLFGNGGNDVIYGGNGDDLLNGGDGSDTLYGGVGSDRLFGGAGADVLNGGAGTDFLTGGSGGDGFVFDSLTGDGNMIAARIRDFSRAEGDYIRLSAIDADPHKAGNQAFEFKGYDQNGGPASTGADRAGVSFRFEQAPDHSWVTVVDVRSMNGAGYDDPAFYTQFWIDGKVTLQAADFVL